MVNEMLDLSKKTEAEVNTGDAAVAEALEAEHKEEDWETNLRNLFAEYEEITKRKDEKEHADFLERITPPADDGSMARLEELMKKLPTSQEITNMEVEQAARAQELAWAIERALKKMPSQEELDPQAIAAKNLENLGAGINFPDAEDMRKYEEVRDEVYQKLFGVSESFAKAKAEAFGKIAKYDAIESFEKARQEAIDYVDNLVDNKLAKERINSPEFTKAIADIKLEARKRLASM